MAEPPRATTRRGEGVRAVSGGCGDGDATSAEDSHSSSGDGENASRARTQVVSSRGLGGPRGIRHHGLPAAAMI